MSKRSQSSSWWIYKLLMVKQPSDDLQQFKTYLLATGVPPALRRAAEPPTPSDLMLTEGLSMPKSTLLLAASCACMLPSHDASAPPDPGHRYQSFSLHGKRREN